MNGLGIRHPGRRAVRAAHEARGVWLWFHNPAIQAAARKRILALPAGATDAARVRIAREAQYRPYRRGLA